MSNFWLFQLESTSWELDLSFIPTYIVFNSILQVPVWYFARRKQWNYLTELLVVHFNFMWSIFMGAILDILLLYSSSVDNIVQKLAVLFIAFFSAHMLAFTWAEFSANHFAKDLKPFSPRVKEPPLSYVIQQEALQALVDVFGYMLLVAVCPFDLFVNQGEKASYIVQMIGITLMVPAPDFVFYVFHGLILHGPLWESHRAHHTIYKPTVGAARKFDAIDWFFEFTMAANAAAIATNYLILKGVGSYDRFLMHYSLVNGYMLSMMQHSGKNLPCGVMYTHPCLEAIPWLWNTTVNELHEGHHNWVSKNYGVFGFSDWLFGTHQAPKMVKHAGAGGGTKSKKKRESKL